MRSGRFVLALVFFGIAAPLWASEGHTDPVAAVGLDLALILIAAKLGGDLATRVGQPAVLGELVFGVLIGNLDLIGISAFEHVATDHYVDILSRIGVLLLLFEVGLESTVAQMMKVGGTAFLVATVGVVCPFVLGYLGSVWILPDETVYAHVFVGATLTATSVGITARVLQDLERSQTPEARIILGAAVIDDVLGLIILAVVAGIIAAAAQGGAFSPVEVGLIVVKACGFLVGSIALGAWLAPRMFDLASKLRSRGVLLAVALSFCFLLSWLANLIGLAPIVGAFAAGLILEDVHFKAFTDRGEHTIEELTHPISSFLVPVFFVVMGARVDLRAFADPQSLVVAAVLIVAAVLGKQACGLAVGRGIDRLSVGLGMIPRGEVGLIFASIGRSLTVEGKPVVGPALFSATVVMVIVTTLMTPPALKWSLARRSG